MVELVDTRDLKSLGFTAVRVQVPLCAPMNTKRTPSGALFLVTASLKPLRIL